MADERTKTRMMELREGMKAIDDDLVSDQQSGLPQPPLEKLCGGSRIIPLTSDFTALSIKDDVLALLRERTSRRRYSDAPLNMDELAFLLWATQGVKDVAVRKNKSTIRTVPSAGARHPIETYLLVNHVTDLEPGLHHYLALAHKLEFLRPIASQADRISAAFGGQTFLATAAVCFVWTAIPYRTEWRYGSRAQKYALLDAGHVCQNLYLACEAIGCGTCAIGAYDQILADKLLGLDSSPSGENDNEFVIYAAPVGKQEQ